MVQTLRIMVARGDMYSMFRLLKNRLKLHFMIKKQIIHASAKQSISKENYLA